MTSSHPPGPLLAGWGRVLLLLLLLLLGGLVLLASSDTFQGLLSWMLAEAGPVIEAHPLGGAALFVLLSALSAMLACNRLHFMGRARTGAVPAPGHQRTWMASAMTW
ncbi:hypothetical protein [Archangium sp.]|uniref:hypothetical protein n=1 Tax=Archangium sp. TaxID=1872627 RepID=UPI00389A76FC